MTQKLVLASSSAQRLKLLNTVNIFPTEVLHTNINENALHKERAFSLVHRLSLEKLNSAKSKYTNSFIIAADTVVNRGTLILGKPRNSDEAKSFLQLLSGRKHKVITGLSACNPEGKISTKVIRTTVQFKHLSISDINSYIKSESWINKSGGYTIDGYAEMFIKQIIGSYSNILGLPLLVTCNMLKGLGYIHKWP